MVCLYGKYIFKGSSRMWHNTKLEYLGIWDNAQEDFFKTYHHKYPNEKIQIYKHKYKPLSRDLRIQIEQYMETDPYFIRINRDNKLDFLLSDKDY